MRWLVALLFLSACDYVLGLDERAVPEPGESFDNDEDHDDIVDAEDPCPHLVTSSQMDRDKDNIGDACDPRPDTKDQRYFFALIDGDLGRLTSAGVLVKGDVIGDPSSVILGALTNDRSTLLLDIDTNRADVAVEATILGAEPSTELGLYAVHREFEPTRQLRGDNCLVGRDAADPPNFLEMNFDDKDGPTEQRFNGALGMAHGTIQLSRTDKDVSCSFTAEQISAAYPKVPAPSRTEVGDAAVSAVHMRVQIHWVWVVVPRPDPAR